ncbi:uncharacterized protein LOC128887735 [Hylaeus anthracinus]|uniref:uncharacterized protein LOC128887735 n=1 Tax=Hylaeus anthracinus TaxID=313031 RepID=UPI0023B91FCE|nr:uncharacterized protein LOC128887735 [Hylaeus anthracinus]
MIFLLSRRLPRSYPVLALLATNLVISMPAPLAKRSPETVSSDGTNGFFSVPKILEIQLPLKIASKDDLVAWAKYVMGLMASKINITLAAVKETPKSSESVEKSDNIKQLNNVYSGFRGVENVKQDGNIRAFAIGKNFEKSRYAENIRNLENSNKFEHATNFGTVRPLETSRYPEKGKTTSRIGNVSSPKEKLIAIQNLPSSTTAGFDNRKTYSTFATFGIADTTVHSPLAITANINVPKSRIKEQGFKGIFDVANSFKLTNDQQFVPPFPELGPALDFKGNDIFRNANAVSPPPRNYLPVTTTDTIKFPSDPFVTRYFFDGVERNVSSNLGVLPSDLLFTTTLRPSIFNEEIPVPVKSVDLTTQTNLSNSLKPLFRVPFEAVITITRDEPDEQTTLRTEKDMYYVLPTRDPPDRFPPYFDTNYTVTNESGQINVVFDDGSQVTEAKGGTRKEQRKKQEKKKDNSSKQQTKSQKTTPKRPSTISRLIKAFLSLRRNNSLPVDLTPPPLTPQTFQANQKLQTPQRTQVSTERPSSLRHGKRNQTTLAQQLEDDDDNDDDNDSSEKKSNESDDDVETNGGDENNGSKENSSDESGDSSDYDDDDEEEGGGSVQAVIELFQLAAPILEDLSDPESDADIADVLNGALPILQELSEGDGENPGYDIPGLLVPILLQFSEGPDGQRDSAAILTPLLQLSAPLIGPLVGPLLVPLSRQSSKPPGNGGSSAANLIKTLLGPLLEPTGPGKMSQLSKLIAGIVSNLSKISSNGKGKSDITSLVKAVVAGSVAGTSAGSSGPRDSYGAPTSYGGDSGGGNGGGGTSYYPPNYQFRGP